MSEIGHIEIAVEKHIIFKFKNKCKFYDITYSEIFSLFVEKFLDGEYDEELNLPKD